MSQVNLNRGHFYLLFLKSSSNLFEALKCSPVKSNNFKLILSFNVYLLHVTWPVPPPGSSPVAVQLGPNDILFPIDDAQHGKILLRKLQTKSKTPNHFQSSNNKDEMLTVTTVDKLKFSALIQEEKKVWQSKVFLILSGCPDLSKFKLSVV